MRFFYVNIATVIFSRVKICFRAKAHLVFHWYLDNKTIYDRNCFDCERKPIDLSSGRERKAWSSTYTAERSHNVETGVN